MFENFRMIISLISCNQRFLPIVCTKLVLDLIPPKTTDEDETGEMVLRDSDLTGPAAEPIILQLLTTTPIAPTYVIDVKNTNTRSFFLFYLFFFCFFRSF